MRQVSHAAICLVAAVCAIATAAFAAEPAPTTQATKPLVNLLAMGDWGTGAAGQRNVARVMKDYVETSVRRTDRPFDGMLLVGTTSI